MSEISAPRPGALAITVERTGRRVIVTVAGEVDLATVGAMATELARLTDSIDGETDIVVVDLGAVSFMAASGLAALVTAEEALRARGTTLRVRNPQPGVAHIFEVTRLTHFVTDGRVHPPSSFVARRHARRS